MGLAMRKAPSANDLHERVKLLKVLVVVTAALFGLSAAVELLWTWSSRPDLAKRDIAIISALPVLALR